jgi:hypothetical protein
MSLPDDKILPPPAPESKPSAGKAASLEQNLGTRVGQEVAAKEVAAKVTTIETNIEKRMSVFERSTLRWTKAAVLVTAATGLFIGLQWLVIRGQLSEMKAAGAQTDQLIGLYRTQTETSAKALEQAKENLRVDQRPYVWLANPVGDHPNVNFNYFTDVKQVVVTFHYTNYGKSPAAELQLAHKIFLGPDALSKVRSIPLQKSRVLLPAGKDDYYSVVSPPISQADFNLLLQKDNNIVVFTRFQYSDTGGHRYESDLCMGKLALGTSWQYCETHNEIKDCAQTKCEP